MCYYFSMTGMSGEAGPRVLHLEDDPGLQIMVPEMLELAGAKVVASLGSLAQALAVVPDIFIKLGITHVITDSSLPDGKGRAFVDRIRQFPELNRVVVIANSADEKEAIGWDPTIYDHYIPKPTDYNQFSEAMTRIYDRNRPDS